MDHAEPRHIWADRRMLSPPPRVTEDGATMDDDRKQPKAPLLERAAPKRSDNALMAQLAGFSLTTAEILYRLPDHPALLQTYVWQDYDISPKFPKLLGFLDYWRFNLEGPLHSVRVANAALIKPAELRLIGSEFRLN